MANRELERMYAGDGYYWGREPNAFALCVLDLLHPTRKGSLSVVELGAGEGRDAVFFSAHGPTVLASTSPGTRRRRRSGSPGTGA